MLIKLKYLNKKYTKETGFLSYYEVCQKISQGWTRSWNTESHVPYADNGYEWIGFDDAQSFKDKVDLFTAFVNMYNNRNLIF